MPVLVVVGTLVRDALHRDDGPPLEDWGGIAFSLEALAAALPSRGWVVRPLLRIPRGEAPRVRARLADLPMEVDLAGLLLHDGPMPTVELRYRGPERVDERLLHVPPPFTSAELVEAARGARALFLNFITGFETTLPALRGLRQGWSGPLWTDLHSLLLDRDEDGRRSPRLLPEAAGWLQLSDAVQTNEDEADRLRRSWPPAAPPPAPSSAPFPGPFRGPLLQVVTKGAAGASCATVPGFRPDPASWPGLRTVPEPDGPPGERAPRGAQPLAGARPPAGLPPLRFRPAPSLPQVADPDPTGCGDVWGAATFARLLAGDDLPTAMDTAHRMAAMNARRRGTAGLAAHLRATAVEVGS
ncbi:MAG: hypothetical protein EA352_10420 [Gemmatimonadales bacterium]|nr:MAG: hypothetical protein EA352_10420 [Gemmatimonadales bacterium]